MKKQNTGGDGSLKTPLRFVVLIPHRDLAGPLGTHSGSLFAAGMAGAFSFPNLAPLALVSRPFSRPELRSLALDIRKSITGTALDGDGKINPGPPVLQPCPGFHSFYGLSLDIPPSPLPYPGVLYPFPALALCLALIEAGTEAALENAKAVHTNLTGFRAAMVANLSIKPLSDGGTGRGGGEPNYSFTWRIGPPCWLPSPRYLQRNSPRNFSPRNQQEEP
ncbi:hypothetical protein TREPR_2236 [Treponema primitia ZAS-2]|uniref:Uncharacterized protein n=1 Tax=Treponema primitia (strain ATCC BAA-887 / DSM 12427 / ZAS-2) TaxID=545694 RepID=F5YIG7_TREPZ|nr:hypothetical protein [Treponema primitia]AEF87022.1 hypothetical protein TREPR_2236 [Treponema primitia ZAS-2]